MLSTSSTTLKIQKRAAEIRQLVENNQFNLATKRLMDFIADFGTSTVTKRDATHICRRFNSLREKKRLYPERDWDEKYTMLVDSILDSIDSIVDSSESPELTSTKRDDNSKNQNNIFVEEPTKVSSELSELPTTQTDNNAQNDSNITIGKSNTEEFDCKTPLEEAKESFIRNRQNNLFSNILSSDIVFLGQNITKTYKSKVAEFTLSIPEIQLKLGEITAIVGENGNGKTTLLKIITGDLQLTDGQIHYPVLEDNKRQYLYQIKQQIAYIPQELSPWSGLLANNLHFAAAVRGIKGKDNEDEVDFIISRLGLDKYRNYTWKEISGGFKMRFALAKALLRNPKLLILDEPLANLDINTQLLFLQDLRYLAESLKTPKSIILSSQNIYDVENIADKIIFIKDGQALYNGYIKEFEKNRKKIHLK